MPILSCSAPNCERPHGAKGYCNTHYNRMRTYGSLDKPVETFTCGHCGAVRTQDKRGRKPKYCSLKCGQLARWAADGERIKAERRAKNAEKPLNVVTCIRCSGQFESRQTAPKFCSQNCANKWRDVHNEARCTADECDRGVQAKGLCSMHWKRVAREAGKLPNAPWNERRKANYQKRRALKLNLPADAVRPLDVYERDEWVCGLCSLPVDRELAYPDPSSASLDHILPLSKGGHRAAK